MVNKYCPKNKGKLRKEALERYQNFSGKEKEKTPKRRVETDIKVFHKKNRYHHNLSEKEKN